MSHAIQLKAIQNLTTGIPILSAKENCFFEVSEYGPQEVTCDLPNVRAAAGQLVSLTGRLLMNGCENPFNATGKIESSETLPEGLIRLRIQLRQFDKDLWAHFLEKVEADQKRVSALLARMKGEEP